MSLTATATFTVADQASVSESITTIVQPPVGVGTGGRGRLVHPVLGTYDYVNSPDETVNIDGDVCIAALWSRAQSIGGQVDTLWPSYLRDGNVIERWIQTDVGAPIAHLRMLWQLFTNPPAAGGTQVIWAPNYATNRTYYVILAGVTAGGEEYKLNRYLAKKGYAPNPVELRMRIIGYAS